MFKTYHIRDFPSRRNLNNEFQLERFEDLRRPPNLQWPHKHSFFEILWLVSGKSTNVIDYHQVVVKPNTLFFISPGQLHLMSKAENVKGYSITFTEEFLLMNDSKEMLLELSFLDNSFTGPALKLDRHSVKELDVILTEMLKEIDMEQKSAPIIGHLLLVLLNKIQRIINSHSITDFDRGRMANFKRFKKNIEGNFRQQKSLPFYAAQLALTPHRLNEICKQVTGKTAGEIIRDRVLLEAKRLLVHSDYPVGQISDDIGFHDFSYFSRQFRKQEGMSPVVYRKKMYEKYQKIG